MKKLGLIVIGMLFYSSLMFSATVESLKGEVSFLINGKWNKAKVGMSVKDGTKIMTGMNSEVKIKTAGGFFSLGELSFITFKEKVSSTVHEQKVKVRLGRVHVRYKKLKGIRSSFKVQTPNGTASVRGTEEVVEYIPLTGLTVKVVEGSIEVINKNGTKIVAYQGDGITVDKWNDMKDEFVNRVNEVVNNSGVNTDQLLDNIDDIKSKVNNIINELLNNEPERL